jgi:hypothetical protein
MTTREVDVIVTAYPEENRAELEGDSGDGIVFVKSKFPENLATKKAEITGDQVNEFLNEMREKELKFSFRLPEPEKS